MVNREKGALRSLFDLNFDEMATLKLVRLAYLACISLTALTAVFMFLQAWSFAAWSGVLGVATLIAMPLVCCIEIVGGRMILEFFINQAETREELRKIREVAAYAASKASAKDSDGASAKDAGG